MRKSKRQRQLDLLERLLDRVDASTNASARNENRKWVRDKIKQVRGGDIELDSGGLTRDDMILANGMWHKHSKNTINR